MTEGRMVALLAKYGNSITTATAAVLLVRLGTIRFATILGLILIRLIGKRKVQSIDKSISDTSRESMGSVEDVEEREVNET